MTAPENYIPHEQQHQPLEQQHLSVTLNNTRPLSLYDNLTSTTTAVSGGRVIQFPDIQFRFGDSIPDRRSVHSSAKSDFFGLSSVPEPSVIVRLADEPGEVRAMRVTGSPYIDGQSVSASPASTASTVPLASSTVPPSVERGSGMPAASDHTSTRWSSRPNSTIKTITIILPESNASLSEAVYMTTTVPQNFTKNANTIIGRHKPTRSSLRHSRMLVVNKTNPVRCPQGNSLNLRHLQFSRVVMILQILIGVILNFIGLGILVWSPSTNTKDNPYWSGLILILCGSVFLLLFNFKRSRSDSNKNYQGIFEKQHQPLWRKCCFLFIHVNALIVLMLTIFFTMLAFIYALIHSTNLSSEDLRCEPQFTFNINSSTCVCTIDTRPVRTTANLTIPSNEPLFHSGGVTNSEDSIVPEEVIRLEYRDFNCNEVHGIWYYVMIASALLNSLGCLLAATFLVIYSVESMREHRAKNDNRSIRQTESLTTTGNMDCDQITVDDHPDTSCVPLVTDVEQPLSLNANTPDTIIYNRSSKNETVLTDIVSMESTLATILPIRNEDVLEQNKTA